MKHPAAMNFFEMKRRAQGLTQKGLAAKLDVTGMTVSKWEAGVMLPGPKVIPKLAKAFKMSPDELMEKISELMQEPVSSSK